jgi:hypothetical protein
MEIGDEERARGWQQRSPSWKEKNVGLGRSRKALGGRAPGSSDDGERGNHAESPREASTR